MFILNLVMGEIMDQVMDWLYGVVIAFFNALFTEMNGMGTELFRLPWTKAVVLFFSKLGWALYIVGIVVAVFETALEYQGGRGSVKDTALNIIKGFLAVNLFHSLPVLLYEAAVRWELMLGTGITGLRDAGQIGQSGMKAIAIVDPTGNMVFALFLVLAIGYSIIKVFFANIKRGGILVVQIAVGSLYMFSVPRGYLDGFRQWTKQVIGICLTAFLQSLVLTMGLMTFRDHAILGTGVLLAATEVPRICGQFGLDTSAKVNVMGGVYAAQTAVSVGKVIASVI